jgi:hypothetical protein
MYLEHLIYSTAIALLFSLTAQKFHRKDYSWLIVIFAYAPDLDTPLRVLNTISLHLFGAPIPFPFILASLHEELHTVGALAIFALVIALILYSLGMQFLTGFTYAALGYGAHLFEDGLVYAQGYSLLWPFSSDKVGIGLFGSYQRNFFGVADTAVIFVGFLILLFAVIIREYGQ